MTPRNLSLDFQPPRSHRSDPSTSFEAEHEVVVTGACKRQADACELLVKAFPGRTATELTHEWEVNRFWARVGLPEKLLDRYAISRRMGQDCRDTRETVREGEPRLARLPGAKRREVTWWPK